MEVDEAEAVLYRQLKVERYGQNGWWRNHGERREPEVQANPESFVDTPERCRARMKAMVQDFETSYQEVPDADSGE